MFVSGSTLAWSENASSTLYTLWWPGSLKFLSNLRLPFDLRVHKLINGIMDFFN